MKTHRDIIDLWPTRAAFAREVGVAYGIAVGWDRRNNITSEHWARLVRAAKKRGFDQVSTDLLAEIQAIEIKSFPERSSSTAATGESHKTVARLRP